MANVSEIREQLGKLLAHQISLDEFEDWFVAYSWNIHRDQDKSARDLAYAIDHALSEFGEDSDALRRALVEAWFSVEEPSLFVNRAGDPYSSPVYESNADAAVNEQLAVVA